MVSFDIESQKIRDLIDECVDRTVSLANGADLPPPDYDTIRMDLTACHANGCPLDLERLIKADDFNFIHDVGGIHSNICRETGTLQNMFLPRFAKKEAAA